MGVSESRRPVAEHEALRQLAQTYAPALLVYCCRVLRDVHLAEDAVQEAFYRALRATSAGQVNNLPAWLFGTARRCCQELARKRRRWRGAPSRLEHLLADPGKWRTPAAERAERLHQALERLTDAQRSIVYMKHTQGLKCREIAEAAGMPLGTVTATLARAYASLRAALKTKEA
jgi:RNA polymerase sigma-70 factor (ECF subfamily)